MFTKLTLAAGVGVGYVLGARAGRERYTQLESRFRELTAKPAVQNAASSVKDAATGMAESAKATLTDKVEAVSDRASSDSSASPQSVDLNASATPMAGAAASRTAPDSSA